ncbi:hypothetical protein DM48_3375 [Burkholderia gladioli]|uniref:Uncharacterized protein n=1 Tax=Burkholderia gladioli TaxID=28095 RepID=A0AAW3F7U6_BURGA|nr:hypothetical protein DM48_3375 [Burkholderia gladioli]SPU96191.1 Uncharacterised protein [Burkholderia gladioli]
MLRDPLSCIVGRDEHGARGFTRPLRIAELNTAEEPHLPQRDISVRRDVPTSISDDIALIDLSDALLRWNARPCALENLRPFRSENGGVRDGVRRDLDLPVVPSQSECDVTSQGRQLPAFERDRHTFPPDAIRPTNEPVSLTDREVAAKLLVPADSTSHLLHDGRNRVRVYTAHRQHRQDIMFKLRLCVIANIASRNFRKVGALPDSKELARNHMVCRFGNSFPATIDARLVFKSLASHQAPVGPPLRGSTSFLPRHQSYPTLFAARAPGVPGLYLATIRWRYRPTPRHARRCICLLKCEILSQQNPTIGMCE